MADNRKIQILRQSPIFSSLSDDELGELAGLTVERSFHPDEAIFREGDSSDYFYVIVSGGIKVVKYPSSGREFIIAFFVPGEMFGEVAVFEDRPYPASAVATTETRVIAIQGRDLLAFLASQPRVALRIINVLGGRLREAQSRLRDLAGERVEQRLASVLMMLASKMGDTLPFTRQEIADMTGTTTETAIRIISHLKERKIISSTRGKIIILDRTKLKVLSDGPPRV